MLFVSASADHDVTVRLQDINPDNIQLRATVGPIVAQ